MRKLLVLCITVLLAVATFTPAVAAGGVAAVSEESPTCEFPLELEDGTGETVTLEEEPESVVALQPSDAQTVFEIGADDKLVGMPVGEFTAYLDADEELDISEGDGVTPVTEEVIDREPDVVLAANALAGDDVVDQLRDTGLEVYVYSTEESLDGVAENVRLTGELLGECEGADESLEWMDDRLSEIEAAVPDEDRPLAYYEMGDGYTAGQGTFQDEILTTAGVDNLGAEAGLEGWETVSEEVVLDADPEWIVYGADFGEPPVAESVMGTTAYQNEQFVAVDSQFMSQPGPLVVEAIDEIAQVVHGDEFEDDAAAADDADGEADDTGGDETDATDGDAESIPGFGVAVAALALIGAIGLFVRR
ncbi:PGF-CTERM-anchored ABC transporter substrate-binding protein [Natrarchaeobaculum sulfurireducens]|uniref:ABC-type Fe3+-hydroxamate transport system, periplasmic component n=1 Tax=Natrarchaeobaculum sulfurireducens TaxID=2044521 RepID=A0A346PEZ4_9EURY|nr:PGF-CTERM-anchored ABC transporter substrate-binding protein [Natrarchaeobaculum sulfurireducens]AXR78089.1 ABC-type Fe3+-hydroxamate transport system, periplasmic component [Natrarchaeobaculum sulfurireducens]